MDIQTYTPDHSSTASIATTQREIAGVQARVMLVKMNPRNEQRAIDNIRIAFSRPKLAEHSMYQYSRGGEDITGPSIRMAEAIAQRWGHMDFGFSVLRSAIDPNGIPFAEVEAYALDYESGVKRFIKFDVKLVRETRREGQKILTSERDIYELIANQAQRRVRSCIEAVIPCDVFEEAKEQVALTLTRNFDVTPERIKTMLEEFAAVGVTQEQIEKRIQRNITAITPALMVTLKRNLNSIKEGLAKPEHFFEVNPPEENTEALPKNRTDSVKAAAKVSQQNTKAELPDPLPLDEINKEAVNTSEQPLTFAKVNDLLLNAADVDSLDLAADDIRRVQGEKMREELRGTYEKARAKFAK